jgi:pyrroloquinoline quinone (PQQ) biosynthesis protein C
VSPEPKLLDHAFYRAWMKGEVAPDTLGAYHRSYDELVRRIPLYWQRVVDTFQPEFPGEHPVVRDEIRHVRLWEEWGRDLPRPAQFPRLTLLFDSLDAMTPSALLGALQAFEVQQPEIARTKKEGLMQHYGVPEDRLSYFDEHMDEESHVAFGRHLAEHFADRTAYEDGFARGAQVLYTSLDPFVAG